MVQMQIWLEMSSEKLLAMIEMHQDSLWKLAGTSNHATVAITVMASRKQLDEVVISKGVVNGPIKKLPSTLTLLLGQTSIHAKQKLG